ncbi:MAG: hypothetical protein ABRQ39_17820 [Candidatus Eremiobacterota bacterium]
MTGLKFDGEKIKYYLDLDSCSKELLMSINRLSLVDQLFEKIFYINAFPMHKICRDASRTYHYLVNNARETCKTRIEWLFLDKFIKVIILSKLLNLPCRTSRELYLLFFPYISFLPVAMEEKVNILRKFDELLSLFINNLGKTCICKEEKDGEFLYIINFIIEEHNDGM